MAPEPGTSGSRDGGPRARRRRARLAGSSPRRRSSPPRSSSPPASRRPRRLRQPRHRDARRAARPARRPSSSAWPARRPTDDRAAWRSLPRSPPSRPSAPATPPPTTSPAAPSTGRPRSRPATTRTPVIDGVLALSLHDFARAHEPGRDGPPQQPGEPDALASWSTPRSSSVATTKPPTSPAGMLDRRPGSAALARASYLRELHGDLHGAVWPCSRPSAATGDPADTAAVTELRGRPAPAAGDLDRRRSRVRADPARSAPSVSAAARAGPGPGRARATSPAPSRPRRDRRPLAPAGRGHAARRAAAGRGRRRGAADDAFALVRANEQLLAAAGVAPTSSRRCSRPTTATRPAPSSWPRRPTPRATPSSPPTPSAGR